MNNRENAPQWLKEALDRGYQPEKIYSDLDDTLFSYIPAGEGDIHQVPMSRIFVLEGLPGAGKTTLVQKISTRNSNICAVPQILPHEPESNQAESIDFYFRSDELKTKMTSEATAAISVLDRYYVSTLAFYWAFDKIRGTKLYDKVFTWYTTRIKSGRLIPPFVTFYIRVDPAVAISRKGRIANDPNNIWTDTSFLHYFDAYYHFFYQTIEPRTRVIYISENTDLDEISRLILGGIDATK